MTSNNEDDNDGDVLDHSSFMCRRLKSFSEPDLEVVVGPNQKTYKYHALILASHSDFVDGALAFQKKINSEQNWRLEFPDVGEDLWESAILYLGPGRKLPQLQDLYDLISFYDQYLFHGGRDWCDEIICDHFKSCENRNYGPYYQGPQMKIMQRLAVKSVEIKLPKSHGLALKYAAKRLRNMDVHNQSDIAELIELVKDDKELLRQMVLAVRGRHCKNMSTEEMLEVVKEPNFCTECTETFEQIKECDEWISNGIRGGDKTNRISVVDYSHSAKHSHLLVGSGGFERRENPDLEIMNHSGGAMMYIWVRERKPYGPDNFLCAMIESMDFFGNVWEISMFVRKTTEDDDDGSGNEDGDDNEERIVLWRWNCGRSSLFPPKNGWKSVAEEESDSFKLSYY